MSIRDAGLEDRHLILRLLSVLYPSLGRRELEERYDAVRRLDWRCLVAEVDGEPAGITGYWTGTRFYCGTYYYIDHVVVEPAFRRSRIGKQLVDAVAERAQADGADLLALDVFVGNTDGRRFWEREGFTNVGLHFNRALSR